MAMNRRNVLVGLGAIAAGGGAVLGTGAFSQVEAERTVNVETSSDANAQVQFTLDSELDAGNDTIEFDKADINADAVTTYNNGLTVTIPDSAPEGSYTLTIVDGNTNNLLKSSAVKDNTGSELQLVNGSVSSGSVSLDTTGGGSASVDFDVILNTIDTTSGGTSLGVSTIDITVE